MDNIKAKIAALMSKTMERGCTEAEAVAASEKASELMAKYGIEELSDFGHGKASARPNAIGKETKLYTYGGMLFSNYIAMPIADLCDCKAWYSKHSGTITYFGMEKDAELACYLYGAITGGLERAWKEYSATPEYLDAHERAASWGSGKAYAIRTKKSFLLGMVTVIAKRLPEIMKGKQETQAQGGYGALVVVKKEAVEEDFKALGLKLRSSKASQTRVDRWSSAYAAGKERGQTFGVNQALR